eukprot:COSAG04_NODE_12351_length_657_cov_0.768817_2_plen_123_part_01
MALSQDGRPVRVLRPAKTMTMAENKVVVHGHGAAAKPNPMSLDSHFPPQELDDVPLLHSAAYEEERAKGAGIELPWKSSTLKSDDSDAPATSAQTDRQVPPRSPRLKTTDDEGLLLLFLSNSD